MICLVMTQIRGKDTHLGKLCRIYTKTDSWFQKSHKEFGQLQTSSGKSEKLEFDGLLLSKKYIPSAKTLYIEDLSNVTLNYLCRYVIKENTTLMVGAWQSNVLLLWCVI